MPIILYGVERIIRGKKGIIFTVGVALTLFNNSYFAYANLLITLGYIVLRMLIKLADHETSIIDQLKKYFIYGLLGIGIALPGFMAFVKGFFQSSSLNAETNVNLFNAGAFNIENILLNDTVQLVPMLFILMLFILSNLKL